MQNEYEVKKEICDIGRRIYNRNMVAANDGNISVKISDNEFLCTPTGVSKGFMTPEYICKVDAQGNVIQANGNFRPSSEIKMHMRVYQERPDVKSVVHAHPVYATSFAIAGIPLTQPIMPEAVIALGCVPIAKYGRPSTDLFRFPACGIPEDGIRGILRAAPVPVQSTGRTQGIYPAAGGRSVRNQKTVRHEGTSSRQSLPQRKGRQAQLPYLRRRMPQRQGERSRFCRYGGGDHQEGVGAVRKIRIPDLPLRKCL